MNVPVRDTAQENVMNALGSSLFHDVVNPLTYGGGAIGPPVFQRQKLLSVENSKK
jgi:hypothetical protein